MRLLILLRIARRLANSYTTTSGSWGTQVNKLVSLLLLLTLGACASTTSTLIPLHAGPPKAAVLPLSGALGEQAADFLTEEFAKNGVAVVETSRLRTITAIDTDLDPSSPRGASTLKSYGDDLGVRYLFAGTVTSDRGPLSSYEHVYITLRLVDVGSGQTRWIGRYGNPMWSSAFSTQGDLKRGAEDIVREFIKAGGPAVLSE